MQHENILTQETSDLLFSNSFHPDVVYEFAQAVVVLRNNGISYPWLLETHKSPKPLLTAFAIIELSKSAILDTTRLEQVKNTHVIHLFVRLLKKIRRLDLLNSRTFSDLIQLDSLLVNSDSYQRINKLKRLSTQFFTDVFSLLTENLTNEQKIEKINAYLLDENYLIRPRLSINRAESTHIPSLQEAFKKAIQKFNETYAEAVQGENLQRNFISLCNELETILASQPTNPHYQAARRALHGVTSDPNFIDTQSGLNLKQLLVLFWQGILDSTRRVGTLSDAKSQFVEALYEIQRGGNINAAGQDNGLADSPICCTGTIHKLLEKLLGIHPFVTLQFVTPELAALKFPIIVKKEMERYLLTEAPELICLKFDYLKEEGVSAIWRFIEDSVREQMLNEFRSLYEIAGSDALHSNFDDLLATHQYLDIDIELLNNIKASYNLKKLESSAHLDSACEASVPLSSSRSKRSHNPCLNEEEVKEKRYRPFTSKNEELKKLLVFLIGVMPIEKREALIQVISRIEESDDHSIPLALSELSEKMFTSLTETGLPEEADFVELTNQEGKQCYLTLTRSTVEENNFFYVYSPDLDDRYFFKFNKAIDISEGLDIFQQILFPEISNFQIKKHYYKYPLAKQVMLENLNENLISNLPQVASLLRLDDVIIPYLQKEQLNYLLIDSLPATDLDQLANTLKDQPQRISFPLEKMTDVFSLLSNQQQVNLGKLLHHYSININENYQHYPTSFFSPSLVEVRKTLFDQFKALALNDQVLTETQITDTIYPYLLNELIRYDFRHDEATLFLDELVSSHQTAKNKLVTSGRQAIVLLPALLQAINGHTENLAHMAVLMLSDTGFNHLYESLIGSEAFTRYFSKTSLILNQSRLLTSAPITKILLISSFFELSRTLAQTDPETAEHEQAKALLLNNSVVFGAMFAESLGLELGPAGILLDLGITLHQLFITAEYLRSHYQLQVSYWEAIKFELGFHSIINDILLERQILHLHLQEINQLSQSLNIHFNYTLVSIPEIIELKKLTLSINEVPAIILRTAQTLKTDQISTLHYHIKINNYLSTSILSAPFYIPTETIFFYKKQYKIKSADYTPYVSFYPATQGEQENNVFIHPRKKCQLLNQISWLLSPRNYKTICVRQTSEVEGWQVVASRLDSTSQESDPWDYCLKRQKKKVLTIRE